jgi:hypothetical protein
VARYHIVGLFDGFWHRNHHGGTIRTKNNQAPDFGLDMVPLVPVSAAPWSWLGPVFSPITCPESQNSPYAENPSELPPGKPRIAAIFI